jgi:hypothetical protein
MRRAALMGFLCMVIGFAGGLLAAPAWRPSEPAPGSPPSATSLVVVKGGDNRGAKPPASEPTDPASVRLAIAAGTLKRASEQTTPPPPRAEHVAFDELPEAVRAVVASIAQGREPRRLRAHRGSKHGITGFQVEFFLDGSEHELKVDEAGKIYESEVDFAIGDLPKVVTNAVEHALPGATLLEAKREQQLDEPAFFEVDVRREGAQYEIRVAEDGKVLRTRPR